MSSDIEVSVSEPGRLDKVVMAAVCTDARFAGVSRSQIQLLIEGGNVRVGERVELRPGAPLKAGEIVRIAPPKPQPVTMSAFHFALDIVHEDANLIVINKPAGISMHPGAGQNSETLVNALVAHLGEGAALFRPDAVENSGAVRDRFGNLRPGVVHRLDKDTTGIVVVAKDVATHHALARQFHDRTVGRSYTALVLSSLRGTRVTDLHESGEVCAPIGRHPTERKRMAVVSTGKPATTHWRVTERFGYANLLELRLGSGRTHQIRVHMHHIGAPVIGDTVYGEFSGLPSSLLREAQAFGRQALHARELAFDHPVAGKRLSFVAEMPKDMAALVEAFRRSGRGG